MGKKTWTSRLQADWRLTIPKQVRDGLRLKPGDYVDLVDAPGGVFLVKVHGEPSEGIPAP